MTAFELQRTNMVESQVRPSDITDRRIIRAMQSLPREIFAAADTASIAYMDEELPVGARPPAGPRRVLLAPRVLAKMIQALEIEPTDRVLEVGTATGYGAAVLSRMAGAVVALDTSVDLTDLAAANLTKVGATTAKVVTGPLTAGWAAEAPYAAILVAGAVTEISPALLDQLQDGGRLVAALNDKRVGRLMQWRRFGSTYAQRHLGEVSVRMLPGFEPAKVFAF